MTQSLKRVDMRAIIKEAQLRLYIAKTRSGESVKGWYLVDARKPKADECVITYGEHGQITINVWNGRAWGTGGDEWVWWTEVPLEVVRRAIQEKK